MNRIELETKLNTDRNWLLAVYAAMPEEQLLAPATPSEHDPAVMWTAKDHLAHLAGIEHNFIAMIRRHLAGEQNPVALVTGADGKPRERADIMREVHAFTENWARQHRAMSLSEVVAVTQQARAATFALMAELSDGQLGEKLPGAPWADGTIGGVLCVNGDHGRMHYKWAMEGLGLPVRG